MSYYDQICRLYPDRISLFHRNKSFHIGDKHFKTHIYENV